ncbi:MAG: hypothetical protein ABFD75_03485 [Smithella sp.]
MSTSLDIAQLKLTSATVELRYDKAYIIWDRAGFFWSEISLNWPDSKINQVEPNISRFIINDRFDLMLSLDRSHIIDLKPTSSLKEFTEYASIFLNLVMESLNISKLTRIGFRLVYNKYFPDKNRAADTLVSTKMMVVPQGKIFNIQGKVVQPKYSLTWEGESTAAKVTLFTREKKIEITVPPGVEDVHSINITKYELIYDIDYYTISPVSRGQFNVKDWIEQAYQLIKRDSKFFMDLGNA